MEQLTDEWTDETDQWTKRRRLCAKGCGELDDNFGAGLDRMVEMLSDIVGAVGAATATGAGAGAGAGAAEEAVAAAAR